MQKHYDIKEIEYTVKFGDNPRNPFLLSLIFTILAIGIGIVFGISTSFSDVGALVAFGLVDLIFIGACLVAYSQYRQVKKWLEDAEECTATVESFNESSIGWTAKITFRYNGKTHKAYSHPFNWSQRTLIGNKVPVLYSPKYDQVMFIKTPEEKE